MAKKKKTIEVIIDETGGTTIKTEGFVGKECLAATMELEAALGRKVSDQKTAEFSTTKPITHTHTA